MKKTISTILVCVLLVGSLLSLASCEVAGFVFGKYSRTESAYGMEYTVTVDFKLTDAIITTSLKLSSESSAVQSTTETVKYKIDKNDEGEKVIILTDEKGTSTTVSFDSGKDGDGLYIEINGLKYHMTR